MDVQDGINMWNQYMVPLKSRGYTIISPSTTSAPDGVTWIQQWLNSGQLQAMPDALATHWYGTSFGDFQSYIDNFIQTFPGYQIWITEFACTVSLHLTDLITSNHSPLYSRTLPTADAILWHSPTRPSLTSMATPTSRLTSPSVHFHKLTPSLSPY